MPFYFQAVQGVSATKSGIRAIPLCLSQIVAVVVVGAIVSKTGHYVRPSQRANFKSVQQEANPTI